MHADVQAHVERWPTWSTYNRAGCLQTHGTTTEMIVVQSISTVIKATLANAGFRHILLHEDIRRLTKPIFFSRLPAPSKELAPAESADFDRVRRLPGSEPSRSHVYLAEVQCVLISCSSRTAVGSEGGNEADGSLVQSLGLLG
eukprot:6199130-Pleurochrysis_carterae.AAC.5